MSNKRFSYWGRIAILGAVFVVLFACAISNADNQTTGKPMLSSNLAANKLNAATNLGTGTNTKPSSSNVELFGHVTLVEGYAIPSFTGCHALVALRDSPGTTVAVMTSEMRLQSLLEAALETGNLIAFMGQKYNNPPTPNGGTWSVDVYNINGVILYNFK